VGADATAANPELEPERLQGIEAGLDYRPLGPLRLGATIFTNRLKHGIANVTLSRGPGVFAGVGFVSSGGEYRQRQNLDAIVATGLEFDAKLDLGSWSLSGGYSFVGAEVRASGPALPLNGLRPAQTPEHSLAGTLSWRGTSGQRASLTARYVGAQYEDDLNQQLLPDAFTLHAAASMPLTKSLSVEARAENVGNARVVAGISGNGIIERATPRTLWIGITLRP
jgi:outer membrane receptor protein involved in Fe transport